MPVLSEIVNQVNSRYFLPAIQREYVWSTEKIELLFDSIMQGFPIGLFLFWQFRREGSSEFPEVYEFVETYHEQGTHNVPAQTNGLFEISLVLDGQQRMTSLFLGLKGSYTEKIKNKRWNNPNAYIEKKLYLNLIPRNPDDNDVEGSSKPKYEFKFKALLDVQPEILTGNNECWFEVGKILNFRDKDAFLDFKERLREAVSDKLYNRDALREMQKTLDLLYSSVHENPKLIQEYTSTDTDGDKILEIFVRTNSGGVELSKSDLLLSMITHHWSSNARQEVYRFQDRLNKELVRKNNFNKDFILKTSLVLIDADIAYKVKNFNKTHLQRIESQWPQITEAIETTVNLVNSFGLDEATLTSHNALIPVIYYTYQHSIDTYEGSRQQLAADRKAIHTWLISVLLNRSFSGQSDNVLRNCREVLKNNNSWGFPVEALNSQIRKLNKSSSLEVEFFDTLLEKGYQDADAFFVLSLLYDRTDWGTTDFHIDHIFPKSEFAHKKFREKGIPADHTQTYILKKDSLANLQLLTAKENIEKKAKPFEEWIQEQSNEYRTINCIPEESNLWAWTSFLPFLDAREALIRGKLTHLFQTKATTEEK